MELSRAVFSGIWFRAGKALGGAWPCKLSGGFFTSQQHELSGCFTGNRSTSQASGDPHELDLLVSTIGKVINHQTNLWR